MINHTKKCYTDYTSIPNFKTPLLEMVYYWVYNIISHNQPHSLVWRFWPPMIAASSLKMPFEVDSSTCSCWWIHPLSIVKSGQPKINPAYCTTIHQLEIKCQRIGCRENQNRKLPLFFWHMGGGSCKCSLKSFHFSAVTKNRCHLRCPMSSLWSTRDTYLSYVLHHDIHMLKRI